MSDTHKKKLGKTFSPGEDESREFFHPRHEDLTNFRNYGSDFLFLEKWDELLDWDVRAAGEEQLFIRELKHFRKEKILDVATGTGFYSIQLFKQGFDVSSADGSAQMLAKASENGLKHGYTLRTIKADWRWLNRSVYDRYDALMCLGNSFTHLHSENDRRKTLAEFYSALRHDGILIIDQRNYDAILDKGFSTKHTYYYAGEQVKAEPEYVDDGLARFRYEFPDQSVYHLNMFPLRAAYVRRLLKEVGFQKVTTYGDFRETHKTDEPDFLIHIAEKEYQLISKVGKGPEDLLRKEAENKAVNLPSDNKNIKRGNSTQSPLIEHSLDFFLPNGNESQLGFFLWSLSTSLQTIPDLDFNIDHIERGSWKIFSRLKFKTPKASKETKQLLKDSVKESKRLAKKAKDAGEAYAFDRHIEDLAKTSAEKYKTQAETEQIQRETLSEEQGEEYKELNLESKRLDVEAKRQENEARRVELAMKKMEALKKAAELAALGLITFDGAQVHIDDILYIENRGGELIEVNDIEGIGEISKE